MITWPGTVGFALVDLALVAAAVAAFALLRGFLIEQDAKTWRRLGRIAFAVHTGAMLSVLGILLGLLLTKQYQYHYVWDHSSNELPLQYIIACFWEGQEGSFMVWAIWHALLGFGIMLAGRNRPQGWSAGVVGIIATVQVLLSSMILGVFLTESLVQALLILVALALGGATAWQLYKSSLWLEALGTAILALLLCTNVLRGQAGFLSVVFSQPAFWLEALLGVAILFLIFRALRKQSWPSTLTSLAVAFGTLALVIAWVQLGGWKVGSSPFRLLRDALPDNPTLLADPNFVPANGTGLNPLLQNYWMVIHPPTLFFGFALTLVPFAFVVAALLRRDYIGWVKPAGAWTLAAVGLLGVGILMGGYWAYETLNFGGYWNWDPVENASFVPWITGVASLHALLVYRHGRTNLRLAMLLVVSTFILVLYSTFLVRSGILGDASVHSFTDLGLSGQLLVLLLSYMLFVGVLFALRWREVPAPKVAHPFLSRETFLLLAVIVLTFAATQISLVTSLPVLNKIFGLKLAPPSHVPMFYYKWDVWFAILIVALSAVGQYVFWTRIEREALLKTLFRPFMLAAAVTIVAMLSIYLLNMDFVYNKPFRLNHQAVAEQGNWFATARSSIGFYIVSLADELLLFGALFTVFANSGVLIRLVRRSAKMQGKVGGSLAHLGFGLMLIGILFSSGYEETVSVNFSPTELGKEFPEEARGDNVLLLKYQPKYVPGYRVVYQGKVEAKAPLGDMAIIYQDEGLIKVGFDDALGDRYALEVPLEFFRTLPVQPAALDEGKPSNDPGITPAQLGKLKVFVEANLRFIQPAPIDGRQQYQLQFIPQQKSANNDLIDDTTRTFALRPEAEVNEKMGLVSHPDTRHTLLSDLYVFVSSVPRAETDTAARRMDFQEVRMAKGDTLITERYKLILDDIVRVQGIPELDTFDIVVRAKLRAIAGEVPYSLAPTFMVDGNTPRHIDDEAKELGLSIRFEGVAPKEGKIVLNLQQEIAPDDYITVKALRKPLINLLWLGCLVMTVGFAIAAQRRARESRSAQPEA